MFSELSQKNKQKFLKIFFLQFLLIILGVVFFILFLKNIFTYASLVLSVSITFMNIITIKKILKKLQSLKNK